MIKNELNENVKKKLFNMLLLLFPNFKYIRIRKDGIIVLRKKNILSRSVKLSVLDAILYFIPNEISLLRWGNYGLVYHYTDKIVEILNSQYQDSRKLELAISYLHNEFSTTKLFDLYSDIDMITIPLENGYLRYQQSLPEAREETKEELIEEAEIVHGNNFSFITVPKRIIKVVNRVKVMAASIMLLAMLSYRMTVNTLSGHNIIVESIASLIPPHIVIYVQNYPWTIIKNTS